MEGPRVDECSSGTLHDHAIGAKRYEPSDVNALREGTLVLADGSVFEGDLVGSDAAVATGEVVFNTVLSGYQEVISDPSYAGQMITFTTPHIGNYGVNATDFESRGTFCRGVIMRELSRRGWIVR